MKPRPKRKRSKIDGQFAWQLIEMIKSPAWSVLSLSGHRAFDRLQIEFAHHGGKENGRLPVTFDDFARFGIHRHAIAPALRELEALGFIEITERGRAGNADYRAPNKFRITHRETDTSAATNDWRRIKSIEEAATLANLARKASSGRSSKIRKPVPETAPIPVPETITKNQKSPVPETITTAQGGNHHYYLDLGEGTDTSAKDEEQASAADGRGRLPC